MVEFLALGKDLDVYRHTYSQPSEKEYLGHFKGYHIRVKVVNFFATTFYRSRTDVLKKKLWRREEVAEEGEGGEVAVGEGKMQGL